MLVAPAKLSPVIVTIVPTGPLVGEKLEMVGVTWKLTLLRNVRLGVTTLTLQVVVPSGTVVLISVSETTVNAAGVLWKVTLVVPARLFPRMKTGVPTLPE